MQIPTCIQLSNSNKNSRELETEEGIEENNGTIQLTTPETAETRLVTKVVLITKFSRFLKLSLFLFLGKICCRKTK